MPNWSSNSMVVYGNFNELKDFRNKLVQAREEGEKTSQWDTYVLYKLFGYSSSEEIDKKRLHSWHNLRHFNFQI